MGRPKISKTAKTDRIGPKTGYAMPVGPLNVSLSSEVYIIRLFGPFRIFSSGLLCFALLCFALLCSRSVARGKDFN